jgi:hypothetical protein
MSASDEQIGTGSRKARARGMAQRSLDLIDAMYEIAEEAQPITGRGIGYKLFAAGLIPSMTKADMRVVYRLLTIAREQDMIPWEWIVDETGDIERISSWDDPERYARCVIQSYRRDYWNQQPVRIELWSEKGTIRGVLKPVLDSYGVGFRVMHGFGSAGRVYQAAQDYDGRPLIALYCGDWDPSGLHMSTLDLPDRLARYDGDHVQLKRIALTEDDLPGLPSFPAATKRKDPRYRWFVENFGTACWELDALDPTRLRDRVEAEIISYIDGVAWNRCKVTEQAEQESLREVISRWNGVAQ